MQGGRHTDGAVICTRREYPETRYVERFSR